MKPFNTNKALIILDEIKANLKAYEAGENPKEVYEDIMHHLGEFLMQADRLGRSADCLPTNKRHEIIIAKTEYL